MQAIRRYLQGIQGRVLVALVLLGAGALIVWWYGMVALNSFGANVSTRIEALQEGARVGSRMEALILEQLLVGEHYLVRADAATADRFDRLGAQAHELRSRFADASGLLPDEQRRLARIGELHALLEVQYSLAHALDDLGRTTAAAERVTESEATRRELTGLIRTASAAEAAKVGAAAEAVRTETRNRRLTMLALLALSTGVGIVLILTTLRGINRPLVQLVGAADRFGAGDLTVEIGGDMPTELARLAGAFGRMADRLRGLVAETVSTSDQVSASASDLSSVAEEVAASSGEVSTAMVEITTGAEEQANGLRSIDEALGEVQAHAVEVGDGAGTVSELGERIGTLAGERREDVVRALGLLRDVRGVVDRTGEHIGALDAGSQRIARFVTAIHSIARQTNLLALNAAIEAARAGEHGRGFAVVADEVRTLADRSAEAATEVDTTVEEIRIQIERVVSSMEAGLTTVSGVEDVSRDAESAFEDIIAAVVEVREAAARVAAAADANQAVVARATETVRTVSETAESHAASAEQVSAAAEEQSAATEEMSAATVELLHAAERLKELVAEFTV